MLIQLNAARMLSQDGAQLVAVASTQAAKLLGTKGATNVQGLERKADRLMRRLGLLQHWSQDMPEYQHARSLLKHNEQFK